jgi:hypothetical protein
MVSASVVGGGADATVNDNIVSDIMQQQASDQNFTVEAGEFGCGCSATHPHSCTVCTGQVTRGVCGVALSGVMGSLFQADPRLGPDVMEATCFVAIGHPYQQCQGCKTTIPVNGGEKTYSLLPGQGSRLMKKAVKAASTCGFVALVDYLRECLSPEKANPPKGKKANAICHCQNTQAEVKHSQRWSPPLCCLMELPTRECLKECGAEKMGLQNKRPNCSTAGYKVELPLDDSWLEEGHQRLGLKYVLVALAFSDNTHYHSVFLHNGQWYAFDDRADEGRAVAIAPQAGPRLWEHFRRPNEGHTGATPFNFLRGDSVAAYAMFELVLDKSALTFQHDWERMVKLNGLSMMGGVVGAGGGGTAQQALDIACYDGVSLDTETMTWMATVCGVVVGSRLPSRQHAAHLVGVSMRQMRQGRDLEQRGTETVTATKDAGDKVGTPCMMPPPALEQLQSVAWATGREQPITIPGTCDDLLDLPLFHTVGGSAALAVHKAVDVSSKIGGGRLGLLIGKCNRDHGGSKVAFRVNDVDPMLVAVAAPQQLELLVLHRCGLLLQGLGVSGELANAVVLLNKMASNEMEPFNSDQAKKAWLLAANTQATLGLSESGLGCVLDMEACKHDFQKLGVGVQQQLHQSANSTLNKAAVPVELVPLAVLMHCMQVDVVKDWVSVQPGGQPSFTTHHGVCASMHENEVLWCVPHARDWGGGWVQTTRCTR